MTTVTRRIRQIKQPQGGYLPIKDFKETSFQTEVDLTDISQENISPFLLGTVVDYLTKYYSDDSTPIEAFDIAWAGADLLSYFVKRKANSSLKKIGKNDDLNNKVIINACYLASLDVAYRRGPEAYDPKVNCVPDLYTIKVIKTLVERSVGFFETIDPIKRSGFTLDESSFTEYINKGNGGFITEEGLWDMKVSIKEPNSKHTLRVLVNYLMGLESHSLVDDFEQIETLGIFNPRLNKSYTLEIDNIDPKIIETVSREVIGYNRKHDEKSRNKDEGFVFFYWNLSNRRKFIRMLWTSLFMMPVIIISFLAGDYYAPVYPDSILPLLFTYVLPLILVFSLLIQTIRTYIKWKNTEN